MEQRGPAPVGGFFLLRTTTTATTLALALLISLAPPASAHTATGAYTIPSTPGISVVCSPNCLGLGLDLGGYQFPANGETPVSVTITDASGRAVPFTACQDANADGICGNNNPNVGPLEPRADGCGNSATLTGFAATRITSVFVRAIDANCQNGGATSGAITLTYAT